MSFSENIDGPVPEKLTRYRESTIARGLVRKLFVLGTWMLTEDRDEDKPQGYRISTWVEGADDRFGYAFGLSRPVETGRAIGAFMMGAALFKIDREKHKLVEEPGVLDYRSTHKLGVQVNSVVDTYDREEMLGALIMADKMQIAIADNQFRTGVDRDVIMGLAIEHLDTLADMYPSPGTLGPQA